MNSPFITAEIGINHNGSIDNAKKLIDMAVECGCDAVKFQKRTVDKFYTKEFLDAPRESPWGTTQRQQKIGLEFGQKEYDEINLYCGKRGVQWYASAWDLDSQEFLKQYDLPYNKVASQMITNEMLLKVIAKERKLTMIATGLNDNHTLSNAVSIFRKDRCPFILMHCVMKYPCPFNECNLSAIDQLRQSYECDVGYSSHNPGILDTSLAVTMGAIALEKHITLDRAMYGTDQPASLEERGLTLMVRDAKKVKEML